MLERVQPLRSGSNCRGLGSPITADSNDVKGSVNRYAGRLCGVLERSKQLEPRLQAVPSGTNLGHQFFLCERDSPRESRVLDLPSASEPAKTL
jgi:hypothetical protein